MPIREILTRRSLPHWFVPHAWHFVTYRLASTIPVTMLHQLRQSRDETWQAAKRSGNASPQLREQLHKQFFAAYDRHLDHNRDISWLAMPQVAAVVRENLHHHRGTKYELLAYSIMPNHVHVLLRPLTDVPAAIVAKAIDAEFADEIEDGKSPLAGIMHSLKSYTANQANAILGRTGQFWQHESYDHWVRDEAELERIVSYIMWNPVKPGLVSKPHEWYFCSAHDRHLADGSEEGFLT